MLSKIMGAISNEQFIEEDLYDRLSDALLERLKDINSRVICQAIAGIYRLQDPNDRVIEFFCCYFIHFYSKTK